MPRHCLAAFLPGVCKLAVCLASLAVAASPPLLAQTAEQEELNQLRSLGYVSFPAESKRSLRKEGLIFSHASRSSPGYTLVTSIPDARALLVDQEGEVVRRWQDPESWRWTRAELQPNGDLLVIGRLKHEKTPRLGAKFLARFSWQGELRWRRTSHAFHHDLDIDSEGHIWTLDREIRQLEDGPLIDDNSIVVLDEDGELLKKHSLFDLLSSAPEIYRLPLTTDYEKPTRRERGQVNLLHANTLNLMPFEPLESKGELYRRSNVLVTIRHQHLIAIIDLASQRLLWAWGPGEIQLPHEATWLENGHILLFDNGTRKRRYSRILEIEPTSGKIVWEYVADPPEDFFTAGQGTVHALPGGNILIASSNQGRIDEVDRQGRVVWRYLHRDRQGSLLSMRAARYVPEMVEPLLSDRVIRDKEE